LLSRHFPLPLEPEDGVDSVRVKSLTMSLVGVGQRRILVEADSEANAQAVYDLLDDVLAGERLSSDLLYVTSAKLQLAFRPAGDSQRTTLTFAVGYPNSCSLKHEPKHDIARQLLKRWGIDVSERAQARPAKPRPGTQRTLRL
jgi:hypothetical protein